MDRRAVLIILLFTLQSSCLAARARARPCRSLGKGAPEGRTFGLLLGQWGQGATGWGNAGAWGQDADCTPTVAEVPKPSPGEDYVDPVYSEEVDDYQDNVRPPNRPRPTPSSGSNNNNFGGIFNWIQNGIITQDKWPQKPNQPPRPPQSESFHGSPSNWFSGWFNQGSYPTRPPRPQRPTPPWNGNRPGDNSVKPVYEHIDEEQPNEAWKPGGVIGGPNNDIIGVQQDLSNWSKPPTPRPTRPSVPGYPNEERNRDTGVLGSFIDLLFKSR